MIQLTLISVHLVCRCLYLVSLTFPALIFPPEQVLLKETFVKSGQSHGYKHVVLDYKMGHVTRKPVFRGLRTTKVQTSLRIHAV